MDVTLLLALIIAVMLLSVVVFAFKNKILFKMGVRNFSKRPKETVIVVIGLLASTAIISGSFIAGETVNYIIERATYDALGAVDETVAAAIICTVVPARNASRMPPAEAVRHIE